MSGKSKDRQYTIGTHTAEDDWSEPLVVRVVQCSIDGCACEDREGVDKVCEPQANAKQDGFVRH